MREFKFRAWDKVHSRMFEVEAIGFISQEVCYEKAVLQINKQCVLMQYTGLKDKTGKEIYEGDIVKFASGWKAEVYFSSGGFMVDIGTKLNGCRPDYIARFIELEVVGNIYENSELLENTNA